MKKQEIIEVLSELHKITGFRVSLHGADYSEIAAYPEKKSEFCRTVQSVPGEIDKCIGCDKEACRRALEKKDTHIYKCRYGLTEAVSPLYNFGTLTGFLMMGQVAERGIEKTCTTDAIKYVTEEFSAYYNEIPEVDGAMIKSYVKIMTICAQYLTLSNAIPSERPTAAQLAKRFIYENYSEKIGIKEICADVGCSKSTLLSSFKREFGITVNSYLNEVRLSEAVRMLNSTEMNIGEVAISVGFSDQSYFSKVFAAKFGVPPSEYVKGLTE